MVKEDAKKGRGGRPKGAKSKINLPVRSIADAVDWTRKLHEKAGDNEFHPEDLVEFLGISKGFVSPALSVLDKFGFIEKASYGWQISDLGRAAITYDGSAIKEALERVDLFRELLRTFGEKKVTKTIIINYLKSKYKKGDANTEAIADKYLEAIDFLSTQGQRIPKISRGQKEVYTPTEYPAEGDLAILLRLKYAVQPVDKKSKEEILDEAYERFKDCGDPSIESLIIEIKKNKENEAVRNALVNALLSIFEKRYPILKQKTERMQEKQTSNKRRKGLSTENIDNTK